MIFVSISGLVEVRMAARSGFGVMGKGSYGSGGTFRRRLLSSRSRYCLRPQSSQMGRKLFWLAQASSSVLSTVKCLSERYGSPAAAPAGRRLGRSPGQQPLAPHRVEDLQQQGPQQPLRSNRRPPHLRVLTSLQQRLVKTGGRLVKHARPYWLMLAESHLTRRLFASMMGRIDGLPLPSG